MFNNNMIGAGLYMGWKSCGVIFDNIVETDDDLFIYISVPNRAESKDVHGNEMSGKYLAKRFKDVMIEMGIKNLTVKCKIREEFWTKEKEKVAMAAAKKELFRSQA